MTAPIDRAAASPDAPAAAQPDPVTGVVATPPATAPGRGRAPQAPVTAVPDGQPASGPAAVTGQTPAGEGRRRAAGASLAGLHAAAMTEAELEEQIRDACKKLGVIRIHIYHARGTTPGVPDDILIGARGVLWRELKTMRGHVSPAQRAMGEALLAAGQDFAIWRPEDWFSGRIRLELMAISGLKVGAA